VLARTLVAATLALALAGCSGGGGDEGGIIGTGAQLKGTVPTERTFARSEIEIRAADGERSLVAIAADGRYVVDDLRGEGPWLLRVDLGNGDAYYAITFTADTQNVHAYSDLVARNWFASRGRDIDVVFDTSGALEPLPTAGEIAAIDSRIRSLIAGSLTAYELGNIDLNDVVFAADDSGVDRFLDANPVLIEDDAFTVIIVDPDSGVQTSAAEAVPLTTELEADDDTPPSAPTVLRVLPSARDEIVLVWEGATDDIGIAGYDVLRDGEVIASTAFPLLLDSPLQPNQTYLYEIVAIDASGNRSQPSVAGSAQTLQAPDTTAPPAPQELQLDAGVNRVRLTWQQSMIGDVAAFRIERGTSPTNLAPLSRVTSTFVLNAGLNSATEYCYRITAVDASENDSPATPVSCVTTGGGELVTAPPTPPTGNGGDTALGGIDVRDLACPTEVTTFRIDSAITLSGSCLRVPRSMTVAENGQLTIAPGTVLKFAASTSLTVSQGGSLTAAGTSDAPIVLSSLDASPGYWDGVNFSSSNSTRNRLENLVIEYAGGSDSGALSTDASVERPVRITADNVLLRHSAGAGFFFQPDTVLDRFARIQSTQNALAGLMGPTSASALTTESLFTGNAVDAIRLAGISVDTATGWNRIGVPFLVSGLSLRASLTMAAGTQVRFDAGGSLYVGPDGSLNAVGTSDAPILLTGSEATPGFWEGLDFTYSASGNNRLEHVTIEYAGGGDAATAGAIVTNTGPTLPVRLQLSSVTLRASAGAGFRFEQNTLLGAFDSVISTSNTLPGTLSADALSGFGSGHDFTGNLRDELDLITSGVEQPLTIPAIGVPYTFGLISTSSALTIAPGVTLRARSGGSIYAGSAGSITAIGTAGQPIVIEGQVAQPGHWDGIQLQYSNSAANRLEFVTLKDGGGGAANGNGGNIRMDCTFTLPVQISIANSQIENSSTWGIYRDTIDTCQATVGANVTFEGNALGNISPQ